MKEVPDTDARQATRGKPVLYILVAALLLAGIGALLLEPVDGDSTPDSEIVGQTDS